MPTGRERSKYAPGSPKYDNYLHPYNGGVDNYGSHACRYLPACKAQGSITCSVPRCCGSRRRGSPFSEELSEGPDLSHAVQQ